MDGRPSRFADQLGADMVARKSAAVRKAGGLNLTPLEVADFIAGQASAGASELRILDPAAGSGTLLRKILRKRPRGIGFSRNFPTR